jgi:2-polyprenyl-3-methyl-5-hydroxy-6-metoxy-1,4-benzoquinol methylase
MTNVKHRKCPSCQSDQATVAGEKHGFQLVVCRDCQTIFTERLPIFAEAENYDEYYTEANLQVPEIINKRVGEIIDGFAKHRQTNRLLDIGFGAGTILQIAQQKDWDVFGVEVSKPAVEQAEKAGFSVFHGELGAAAYPDHYFDVITASEIVEHLPEPQELFNEVARILRPGGLFWVTTPSAHSLSYRLMGVKWSVVCPPEHIQLFSQKGIIKMLKTAGFTHIKLQTHGVNPMEIVRYYRPQKDQGEKFDRVNTYYKLNENLTKSPTRQKIKDLLNGTLNVLQVGDCLKIFAHTEVKK